MTPPRALQVNGNAATSSLTGVGLTPTVSWTAPAVGTPTAYSLAVYEVDLPSGTTTPQQTFVAQISITPDLTRIAIPSGLLQAGHHYALSLSSRLSEGGANVAQVQSIPFCWANAVSDVISP